MILDHIVLDQKLHQNLLVFVACFFFFFFCDTVYVKLLDKEVLKSTIITIK